jgi:glutamyl-tRNA synthetase
MIARTHQRIARRRRIAYADVDSFMQDAVRQRRELTRMRGRFAPSPSGLLHIGNAFAALLAWLQVRSVRGVMILRIEDIDRDRSKPIFASQILDDLRWLGLDWDEGPDVGGPRWPYRQSDRLVLYEDALAKLDSAGHLYPCFCSRAELLAVARAPHGLASEGPAYPGTCRTLTESERRRRAAVKPPALRFALPCRDVRFSDLILGPRRVPAGTGGDFVVRRADGVIAYQLAVTVDDAAMLVTDVLRGSDLLDSTPRQILLYEALGLTPPRFAHAPLLVGPDGRRLAKRADDLSLTALRAAGVSPERLTGWLAHAGGLLARPEPIRAAELIPLFRAGSIPRAPVVVDDKRLRSLTGE